MKPLKIVALVAGAFSVVVGVWGIVVHSDSAESAGSIESGFLWVAIGILSLAIAVLATNFASRD
jgi:hypothetical protein